MAEKALFWVPSWMGWGGGGAGHQVSVLMKGEQKISKAAQGGQIVFRYTLPIPGAPWS